MEHGFEATSLRQITALAEVNLAAVNYHFGSKEELFESVLTRRLDPMNQRARRAFDALRARGGAGARCLRADPDARCSSPRSSSRAIGNAAAEFPAAARPRLCRSGAVHPPVPVRAVRGDDRALQGGVRAGAAGAAEKGAVLAAALRHGRPVVHARRNRCAEADRCAQPARHGQRRSSCCVAWRRSWSPG